ncbi:MAG: RIP metalloprotease RseP [Bdellovibrionaceae bacterium]|nr:RIP metalloprotease RseP [Pseudobdellovibrionaceae bacterium]
MDFIQNILQQGLSFIVPMTILLGVLIFIHELGHFLVAKYFHVKVETFSLGFGPKLLKFVRGETTYCLSAIPFGGYVKMYGDEIGGDVPADMRNRSFLHKPIYQRILIALAGPVMNLALAFILFFVLTLVGEKVIAPRLGDIKENTYAYTLGFRSGDKILAMDGDAITRWSQVEEKVAAKVETPIEFKILRETEEEPISILAKTESTISSNPLEPGKTVGAIGGLDFISDSSLVGIADPQSLFGQIGFETGDQIVSINKIPVFTFRQIQEVLISESSSEKIVFVVDRYGIVSNAVAKRVTFEWDLKKIPFPDAVKGFGYYSADTFVGEVMKDTPAQTAGIQASDRLVSINDRPIKSFSDIPEIVSSYRKDAPPLNVKVMRAGKELSFSVVPKLIEFKSDFADAEERYAIGVRQLSSKYAENINWHPEGITNKISWASANTWQWTKATVMSFVLLVKGDVSPKNLGGFISIGQMAKKSWEIGLDSFLRLMAIISLNLFVLNLLPVPVLDGGHILFFTIEAIKGSPISLKKLEIAQQIGVFALLSLLAFSLFNDFARLF